jgi:hypothetical protein
VDDLITKHINRLIHKLVLFALAAIPFSIARSAVPEIDVHVALLARAHLSRKFNAHHVANVTAFFTYSIVSVSRTKNRAVSDGLESIGSSADEELANLLVRPLALDSVHVGVAVLDTAGPMDHAA